MGSAVRNIWNKISTTPGTAVDPAFWRHRATVAALLFKVMPIDGEIHVSEQARLKRILADEFSIDDDEVDALVYEAQLEVNVAGNIAELSKNLKAALTHKDKLNLISHMWEMVFADGRLHEYELLLVERVALLLGVAPNEVTKMMNSERSNSKF